MNKCLCKYRGKITTTEIWLSSCPAKCPQCDGTKFSVCYGWIECDECGFAYLEKDIERIASEKIKKLKGEP